MSRRRTRTRRLPTRRLLFLAIFVLTALVGASFVRVSVQASAMARESAGVRAEIALLEAQRAMLTADIAMRGTDAYVEQQARELGYVKPGEGLASVRDGSPRGGASGVAESAVTARLLRWLALFFHP